MCCWTMGSTACPVRGGVATAFRGPLGAAGHPRLCPGLWAPPTPMAFSCCLCFHQGHGEPLRGVWEHSAASEERRRLPQQCHVVPVLGEGTQVLRGCVCVYPCVCACACVPCQPPGASQRRRQAGPSGAVLGCSRKACCLFWLRPLSLSFTETVCGSCYSDPMCVQSSARFGYKYVFQIY